MQLHSTQQTLLDKVLEGKNLFFTGSAGSGKSTLLREIIKRYKSLYGEDKVAICGLTGLSASQIGGCTIHSFAGIGLGNQPVEDLIKRVGGRAMTRNKWINTKVWIIDEISMLEAGLLDKLDQIGKEIRNRKDLPFGGIQIIATGDFFQLPPIGKDAKYAFEACCWNDLFPPRTSQKLLTKVFRQQDPVFVSYLNNLRYGTVTPEMDQVFTTQLARPVKYNNGLEPTVLFPTRSQVQAVNEKRLQDLPGKLYSFHAIDTCLPNAKFQLEKLQKDCIALTKIDLKVGAQVMLLKNLGKQLVNGSLGIVTGFQNSNGNHQENQGNEIQGNDIQDDIFCRGNKIVPIVEFQVYGSNGIDPNSSIVMPMNPEKWNIEERNVIVASRTQIPLTLAYALTVHKSQGMTIPRLKMDLGRVFERGQAYVSISRAQSMDRLEIYNFDKNKVTIDEKVVAFHKKLGTIPYNASLE